MKIKEYFEINGLIAAHKGHTVSKSQKAKQRKTMKRYWLMKNTTFDEEESEELVENKE